LSGPPTTIETPRATHFGSRSSIRACSSNEREVLLGGMEWGDWDAFLLAGRYTLASGESPRCRGNVKRLTLVSECLRY
jgi:hypothetical protein